MRIDVFCVTSCVCIAAAEGARNALSLAGTMLGYYPVRVLPSKTAIAPVNPTFLPRVRFFYYATLMMESLQIYD